MSPFFFCENPRCQFHLETTVHCLLYLDRNDEDKEKRINRLHVVQQTASGTPRDYYFCENCANVLAMTFGQATQTKNPKPHVSKKQTTEQEAP